MNNAIVVNYTNPFRDAITNPSTCETVSFNEEDKLLRIVDNVTSKVIDYGALYEFTNFERQVDFTAAAITLADTTAFSVIVGLQIGTMANQFLHLGLEKIPFLWIVPTVLKVVAAPLSFFFIGAGLIEGFAELIQIKRTIELLQVVQKGAEPMEKLAWFRAHYFSLTSKESEHTSTYINRWLPNLTKQQKAERFDRIAFKILKIKYEQLENRIKPKLAEAIKTQLGIGVKELANKTTAEMGISRLEANFQAMEKQAKIKIISHTLLIIAITIGLIGSIAATGGFSSIPLMVCIAVVIITLLTTKFLIDKGVINRAAIDLYDRLDRLNLLLKETKPQVLAD